jgi:hypothetical protein
VARAARRPLQVRIAALRRLEADGASLRRYRGIFDRTSAVFDEMRAASARFAIEQFAYTIVLPAYGVLEETAPDGAPSQVCRAA